MLYEDPHRWGFAFQANAQMSLARLHSQPAKSAVKVMERSIFSARYCFVENLYRKSVETKKIFSSNNFSFRFSSNVLQSAEYEILKDWFEMLVANDACHLDLISECETEAMFLFVTLRSLFSLSPRQTRNMFGTNSNAKSTRRKIDHSRLFEPIASATRRVAFRPELNSRCCSFGHRCRTIERTSLRRNERTSQPVGSVLIFFFFSFLLKNCFFSCYSSIDVHRYSRGNKQAIRTIGLL